MWCCIVGWMGTNVTWEHAASVSCVMMKAPGPSKIKYPMNYRQSPPTTIICTWQQHKILNSGVWQIRCRMGPKWMFTYLVLGKQKKLSYRPQAIWISTKISTECLNYNLLCILTQRLYFPHQCNTSIHL
jgi:hypothetical protein